MAMYDGDFQDEQTSNNNHHNKNENFENFKNMSNFFKFVSQNFEFFVSHENFINNKFFHLLV